MVRVEVFMTILYSRNSKPGVCEPQGVHEEISGGTWMAVKFSCVAIV